MHYKPLSYIYFNTSICEHFRNFGIYKIACAVFFYCTWPQCTYMTLYETHYKTMIMIHYNSIIMYIHVLNHDNQLEYNTMYVHVCASSHQ